MQKVLEDANVKLGSVLSDVFGVSGQLMLEELLKGQAPPKELAALAQKRAKKKIPQIIAALEGHQMSAHHRRMIRFSLEHLRFLEEQLGEVDHDIAAQIEAAGLGKQWEDLRSIPGIQQTSAAGRNRWRYEAVSLRETPQLLGRGMSGEQPKRGQAQ